MGIFDDAWSTINPFDDEKGHGFNGGWADKGMSMTPYGMAWNAGKMGVDALMADPAKPSAGAHSLSGDATGSWTKNTNDTLQGMAGMAQMRTAPTAKETYSNVAPWQQGVVGQGMLANHAADVMGNSAGRVTGAGNTLTAQGNAQNLWALSHGEGQGLAGNAANRMLGLSNEGQGQGQVGAAGNQMMALGQARSGPSLAEMSMARQGEASMRQQAAMAAGARGGNAQLANLGAAQSQGQIAADLGANLGMQRASEDLANRQFQAQALQGAAGIYGNQRDAQAANLGNAANIYGGQAAQQLNAVQGAGAMFGQAGSLYGNAGALQGQAGALRNQTGSMFGDQAAMVSGQDRDAAALAFNQQQQNDQYALATRGQGYDLVKTQAALEAGADIAKMNADTENNKNKAQLVGTTMQAGASAAGAAASDKRGKRNIRPADDEIASMFRGVGADSYEYRDPSAPGAAPGRHFGPMAQDLERSPAGRSLVNEDERGRKYVDTGRLALVSASEVGKQRSELDELKRAVFGGRR